MMRKLTLLAYFILASLLTAGAQEVKSIILLIGDGMGLAPVAMMQLESHYEGTIFDRAENIALQRTWSLDNRVTDSAASGTALATGHKTNNTYLGVTTEGEPLESLTALASKQGMATGVVATTYLQHATPGAFYAHSITRHDTPLITRQLTASHLDVAIGGGMAAFREVYGSDEDVHRVLNEHGFGLVRSLDALSMEDGSQRVMALVADWDMGADSGDYLARATAEALRLMDLRDQDNGFVLMVEGSLIDGMGHGNDARAMQLEMRGFMDAVEVAVEYASKRPGTLVVVTADHDTGAMGIVSSNADFNLSEQGVEYRFATDGHSAEMVPIYLYGTGAEHINGIMENSELGQRLKELITR